MGLLSGISGALAHGDIWIWVILFTQVASIAIIVERTIFLYSKRAVGQRKAVDAFEKEIKSGRLAEVKSKAQASQGPVGQVIVAGVDAAMNWGGKDEIRGKMDEVLLEVNAQNETRTGFLAMLANAATLTGLLGTVTGMIKSFAAVSNANPMEKAALLSAGISEAMNATAYGLVVAIPALVGFSILANRGSLLSEDLNQASLKVYNWLSYSYDPAQRAVDIEVPKKNKAQSADI